MKKTTYVIIAAIIAVFIFCLSATIYVACHTTDFPTGQVVTAETE